MMICSMANLEPSKLLKHSHGTHLQISIDLLSLELTIEDPEEFLFPGIPFSGICEELLNRDTRERTAVHIRTRIPNHREEK